MKVTENLILISEIFSRKAPLYLVGGYVRNSLMGIDKGDIDICSALTTYEVEKLLLGTKFKIVSSYKKLGTLVIQTLDEKETYEYTTFREDSYKIGTGTHTPVEVNFVRDIKKDALRRDFKINAIYYDILKSEYVDPILGIKDLISGIITTTRKSSEVFAEDPLRIMRLVRQASELNFKIDEETYKGAKENAHLLFGISPERKKDELIKILKSDTCYDGFSTLDGPRKGVEALLDLGAMNYILNKLVTCKGINIPNYEKGDLLHYALIAMFNADVKVRLAALLHNVGKAEAFLNNGNIIGHEIVAESIVHLMLGEEGLKFPHDETRKTARLLRIIDFDANNTAKLNTIKKFIVENDEIFDSFILLRKALRVAYNNDFVSSYNYIERFEDIRKELIEGEAPFKLQDLKVNGFDCINAGIANIDISTVLKKLQLEAIYNIGMREKNKQLEYLKRYKKED